MAGGPSALPHRTPASDDGVPINGTDATEKAMMYWNGDWNAWAWLAMTASMLAFWALVGIAIWLLVRRPQDVGRQIRTGSPEEILRQRYAAGEVDDDEFKRRLQALRDDDRERTLTRSG